MAASMFDKGSTVKRIRLFTMEMMIRSGIYAGSRQKLLMCRGTRHHRKVRRTVHLIPSKGSALQCPPSSLRGSGIAMLGEGYIIMPYTSATSPAARVLAELGILGAEVEGPSRDGLSTRRLVSTGLIMRYPCWASGWNVPERWGGNRCSLEGWRVVDDVIPGVETVT